MRSYLTVQRCVFLEPHDPDSVVPLVLVVLHDVVVVDDDVVVVVAVVVANVLQLGEQM